MENATSKILPALILALGLAALPHPALAWGPEGHEVVGNIAAQYLTPRAAAEIKALLGSKKIGSYEISCWPDIIRGNREYEKIYPGNGTWHYIDFDVWKPYSEDFELKVSEDGQDVVSQIRYWQKELAAADTPRPRRKDALKFLVHFVGDVHQPMHCAFRAGDMGGNMIPINSFKGKHYSFDADTPMDWAPNLHSAWDEYLVNELMAGVKPRTFANRMVKEISAEQIRYWDDDDPLVWATDSYWRARKEAYRWTNGQKLPYTWKHPGMDLTSENYIDSHLPIVQEQLAKAGVRLALLLNSALDPDFVSLAPPEPEAAEASAAKDAEPAKP
jgi:hypothetical protein